MPRIKVFTANLGFYETAVAARSQKMALAHWGVTRDLFHEGTAKETNDRKAVEAAMRKVGMVVRRPIGSIGPFEERADAEQTLLKTLSRSPKPKKASKKPVRKPVKKKPARRKG
jgi:colicin import membrane protein